MNENFAECDKNHRPEPKYRQKRELLLQSTNQFQILTKHIFNRASYLYSINVLGSDLLRMCYQ